MASNRNRTAGHNYERDVIKKLKEIGYSDAVSSRYASRITDDAGIDIMGTDDIAIQCKNTARGIDYCTILEGMNTDKHKVILHKRTEKKGSRFCKRREVAILDIDLFYELLESRR